MAGTKRPHPECLRTEDVVAPKRATLDSNIAILLGADEEDTIVMGKRELARKCEYFAEFEPDAWPVRFTLPTDPAPARHLVIPAGSNDALSIRVLTGHAG